ncbi:MAG: DUF4835 family protein [Prolixibacteraceae bacterium]|nr:DUF4835 family protein [Prolixibacteraceae bacterium]
MKKILFILLVLFFVHSSSAQELRCNISVNASKITGANRNVFRTMQMDLYEFMNSRNWTSHKYSNNERIVCSINIQLNRQISSDEYEGIITVQSKRPAYGSSYKTTVLNIRDESFRCKYQEYQSIEFAETGNKDNLTSILAFYAYVILGFDYDTFSPNGGTEYFQRAREIVNDAQNFPNTYTGWRAYESDYNRYWLVENVLNSSYSDYRECLYKYHRDGLDAMSESVEAGRAEIAESLRLIQNVFRVRSRLYITQMFFDAKSNEIVNIFSQSYPDEQERVVRILSECDPSNAGKYEAITNSEN